MKCVFLQPDSSVQPFFDSMIKTYGIQNLFSMQLCGTVFKQMNDSDLNMGGSLVRNAYKYLNYSDLNMGRSLVRNVYKHFNDSDLNMLGSLVRNVYF